MPKRDRLAVAAIFTVVFTIFLVFAHYAPYTAQAQVVIGPTGGGGGGPAVTQGTYASIPAVCSVNDLYLTTDNIFLIPSRCSASNTWSNFVLGGQLLTTIAARLSLTSSLQTGVTVSSTHGYEQINIPAGGTANGYSFRSWTRPALPYTQYVYMRYPARFDSLTYQVTGVGFTDGTHLFGVECGEELNGTTQYDCRTFLWSGGTYGGFPLSLPVGPPVNGGIFVWALGMDASSLHLGVSTDGGNSFDDLLPATCVSAGFTSCAAITSHFYGGWNSTITAGTPPILIGVR
jgi:hypothetical protein